MEQRFSRFAVVEDVMSPEFMAINRDINKLHIKYGLTEHRPTNGLQFPWSVGLLEAPEFFAARMWEFPFAILAAELEPGMKVADIGCGMTPFVIYLKEHAGCDVTGVDPDIFETGMNHFGVSREFIERTGLRVLEGDFNSIPLESDSQDRVFSLSVMEHVPADVRRRGIQEIARILKPGGRAIITVDMSMWFELNRPLDLVWDSGMVLMEPFDLRWPTRRFGMFAEDQKRPADVFGMTLVKEDRQVETRYRETEEPVPTVPAYRVPTLAPPSGPDTRPLWRRVGSRLKYEALKASGKRA
ncbi:MAG TPA: class I SAM-dependent methyltransferase [Pyrinomonadaceae bacterium]|jgi:SAM-dependent methyltransferase